jgi:hypothetical protein
MPSHNRATGASRRALLAAGLTSVGLAGCLGGETTPTPTPSGTAPATTPTATATTPTPDPADPLTGTEGGETDVSVTDYGAAPDDESDDTAAIRQAFRAAARSGATVSFEAGTYRVHSETPGFYQDADVPLDFPIVRLRGYEGLTVEGNGATLSARGRLVDGVRHFAPTFQIEDLTDTTIRNLTVDWDRDRSHSAGRVVADTESHFDLEVNDPYTPREGLFAVSFIRHPTDQDRVVGPLYLQRGEGARCHPRSESVLRVEKSEGNSAATLQEGRGVVVRHTSAAPYGLKCYETDGLTLENLTLHTIPGMAVNVHSGADIVMDGVSVVPSPTEGVWQSAGRDAFHIANVSGALTLRNLAVAKTGDDAFNLKGRRYTASVPDPETVVVERAALTDWCRYPPLAEGDAVELGAAPLPSVPAATRTIDSLAIECADRGVGVVTATYRIGLDEPLPDDLAGADSLSVFNTTQTPDSIRLADSTVGKMRGTSRFQLDHLTIEDCEFHDTMWAPLVHRVGGPEGEPEHDFALRNCTFRNTARITMEVHGLSDTPPMDFFADHTYEGNTWRDHHDGEPALALDHISDVTIADNDFGGVSGDPIQFGPNVACDTVTIDGETGCE